MMNSQPAAAPQVSRILLASDFSARAQHAAWFARMFARIYHARVWVAHAVVPSTPPDAALLHSDGAVDNAEHHMQRFVGSRSLQGVSLESLVRPGELWPVLSRIVEEQAIDLIVAGTHGRGDLGRVLLGSTAELILRNSGCPVLTISPHVKDGEPEEGLLRIVFPVGGNHFPVHSLRYATRLANEHNAQLIFINVVHAAPGAPADYPDIAEIDDEAYAQAKESLTCVAPDLSVFRREPEMIVESGMPGETIVGLARATGADLIFMPVRHESTRSRSHAVWKTVSWVVAHAECPVMTFGE